MYKLTDQIYSGIRSFLGLDEKATETEISTALENQKEPLSAQIEAAKSADVVSLQKQIDDLTSRVSEFETKQAEFEQQIELKDTRISELQTELATASELTTGLQSQIDSLKAQHATEVKTLAGQVASLKVNAKNEQAAGDNNTAAASKKTNQNSDAVVVEATDHLKNLMN